MATIVDENVNGVRVVKSFAAEERQITGLARAAEGLRWANVAQADARARYAPAMENLPRLGLAAVLAYGGWLAIDGQVGIGTLVAFTAYVVLLQTPFRMLGFFLMMTQRAAASAGRIYEILDEAPAVVDRPGAVDLIEPQGRVDFRDVHFTYTTAADAAPVLNGFDLTIEPGETVALVGRTASGKSTVARLLPRFYDVSQGAVLRRRPRRAGPDRAQPAGLGGDRDRRAVPVLGAHPGQHRLRPTRRERRRRRGRGPGGSGPRLHHRPARRLRHRRRRAGLHAVRRPAPAHRVGPDHPGRPPPPGARRRHQRRRRPRRGGDPRRPDRRAHGPHDDHRGPPALQHRLGRPRRAARARTGGRRRHPRRAPGHRAPVRRHRLPPRGSRRRPRRRRGRRRGVG